MRIMNFILPTIGARVIGVALSVALSAQVGLAAGDAHADAVGQVSRVQLTAYGIPPEGKKTAKALTDGVVMRETLETVPNGGLQVSLIDDTTLTLGGGASLVVDELVYDPQTKNGNSVLKLATGTFLYVSGSMNKKGINISTPTSTIGVRGTKLLIKIAADGTTSVGVIEGAADVQSLVDGSIASIEPGDSDVRDGRGRNGVACHDRRSGRVRCCDRRCRGPGINRPGADGSDYGDQGVGAECRHGGRSGQGSGRGRTERAEHGTG